MLDQFLDESRKKQLFNAVLASIVLLAVFLGVKVITGIKEYTKIDRGYPSNSIAVIGKGEVVSIPDTASFSFSVTEEAKKSADAQDASAKKMNAIIVGVKALGVDEKDIKTTGYNLYPKYDYTTQVCTAYSCGGGKQTLRGYEVSQTVTVKVRKTADAGAVLSKVGELGGSNISGIDFVIDDTDKIKMEAQSKAIADARIKAEVLAKSLGVKLSRIVNFSESTNQPPIYYSGAMMEAKANSAPTIPDLPVGENKITSQVMVTYEIE